MRKSNFALRLQLRLLEEARKVLRRAGRGKAPVPGDEIPSPGQKAEQ